MTGRGRRLEDFPTSRASLSGLLKSALSWGPFISAWRLVSLAPPWLRFGWPAGTALVAAAVWALSLATVDVTKMSDLGLVSLLPATAYASLALLTASFFVALHFRQTPTFVLLLHVVVLIALIHGTPPALYGTLRYSWAWKHVGIVDYIQRHGAVDPTIGYLGAYHNWPGFFAMVAFLVGALGVGDALGIAIWSPPVFNLLFVGGLLLIVKALTPDRRLLWLSAWIFASANWVGQDYFSPQAMSYFLHLVVVGICLQGIPGVRPFRFTAMRRLPGNDDRIGLAAIILALFTFIVVSHQLTPFMTMLAVSALVVSRRFNVLGLPLLMLMGLLTATWAVYVAAPFLRSNIYWVVSSIFDLFGNLDSNFIDLSKASEGQRFVATVDRVLTASVMGLAILGCVRRFRGGHFDLTGILLVLSPLPMLALNSYGGEMVFRVYFFALPFAAFFAAASLYPTTSTEASWWATPAAAAVGVALLIGLTIAYYGKDRMYYFTPGEVAAAQYLTENAPAGSLWVDGTWDWPLQYRHYEIYEYFSLVKLPKEAKERLEADPVGVISGLMQSRRYPQAYLIITRSQKAEVEMTGVMPAGSLDLIETMLRRSSLFQVIFENKDAVIFRMVRVSGGSP